jgi:hypothetical protein
VNRLVKPYFDPNHPIPLMGREFLVTLTFNLERGHE